MKRGVWRWLAGAAIAAALAAFAVLLAPHYQRHGQFQRALERLAREAQAEALPEGVLRARVRNAGARLGLELREAHVRVRRTSSGVRLEVRYPVRVELGFYAVTLHFRARAGG